MHPKAAQSAALQNAGAFHSKFSDPWKFVKSVSQPEDGGATVSTSFVVFVNFVVDLPRLAKCYFSLRSSRIVWASAWPTRVKVIVLPR